jgi:tetrahydromethanopterin S-methyltransferase subunit C
VTTGARRRRKKSSAPKWIALGVVCVLVFAVGIALGEALNDNPGPGHTRTLQRTLTLAPESATVTVTAP